MLNNKLDLTGQIYRNILVLSPLPSLHKATLWLARCLLCNKEFEVKTVSLRHWGKNDCGKHKKDENKYRKYSVNDLFFNTPTLINSYWAGFIAADGCINNSFPRLHLELSKVDEQHLLLFKNTVGYTGIIEKRTRGNKHFVKIQISSRQWKDDLYKVFNVTPRKSFTLLPPNITGENLDAYVAGLIDGDGWIGKDSKTKKYTTVCINTASNSIILFIQEYFLHRLNKHCNIHKQKNTFSLVFSGTVADTYVNFVRSLNVPLLRRKWYKDDENFVDTEEAN